MKLVAGLRIGWLVLVEPWPMGSEWICQCDCGNKKSIPSSTLATGFARSCDCLFKQARFRNHEFRGNMHTLAEIHRMAAPPSLSYSNFRGRVAAGKSIEEALGAGRET